MAWRGHLHIALQGERSGRSHPQPGCSLLFLSPQKGSRCELGALRKSRRPWKGPGRTGGSGSGRQPPRAAARRQAPGSVRTRPPHSPTSSPRAPPLTECQPLSFLPFPARPTCAVARVPRPVPSPEQAAANADERHPVLPLRPASPISPRTCRDRRRRDTCFQFPPSSRSRGGLGTPRGRTVGLG